MGGEESGSEGGGVDIVEAGFDVEKRGRDFEPGPLAGSYLVHEREAGVGGAESQRGAALAWMEEALGPGEGTQPDCHYPLKDFRDGLDENDNTEGGGGIVEGLAGLVQNHLLGAFGEGGW